jgi:hypothetical protein
MPDDDFSGSELASWLQEAGRRRVVHPAEPEPQVAGTPVAAAAPAARPARISNPRQLILLAIAALAYLPYFYADVNVQIASLPRIIVFV